MEHDAPPHRRWADLDAGLLSHIADYCTTLRDYAFFRAVCTAWRSPLPPPTSRPLAPVLLPGADGTTTTRQPLSFAAWGLLAKERWSTLHGLREPPELALATDYRCVGARDGWVALDMAYRSVGTGAVWLFNPVTGVQIHLQSWMYDRREPCRWASKVVFSSSPSPRDFAAVSICGPKSLAVQKSCDGKGGSVVIVIDTDRFMDGGVLTDVAYCDNGTVYCLTEHGGVHVLHLNRRHRRGSSVKALEVKPLLAGTDAFPAPYDTISRFTDAKSLVLCDGALYQIWRRPCGAGPVDAPAGGEGCLRQVIRIQEGDVFVLRYDPGRWPTWSQAKDLGGYAVFVGKNDAVSVRVEGVTGLKGDCIYYWDKRPEGDYEAVVFDMATRRSARWLPAQGGVSSPLWYFLPASRNHVEATTSEEDTNVQDSVPAGTA